MFDLDTFIAECRAAVGEPEPRLAIKEVLAEAVADPAAVAEALPPNRRDPQAATARPS